MHLWSLWLIIAVIFFIVELFSQSVWSLCVALGALAAMTGAMLDLNVVLQGALLVGVCILGYIGLLPWLKKFYQGKSRPIATGMDALIGRKAITTEPSTNVNPGRAKIDGDNWQIRPEDSSLKIPAGTEVTVVGYDSIILIVKPTGRD
ncbi:MAG: NfeD family protein [Muribaculaceae bacterium]|nr:NfeD family protein [Muribaculaceae bacterium]